MVWQNYLENYCNHIYDALQDINKLSITRRNKILFHRLPD